MDDKFYIKKIVRDDGEAFGFDGQEIYLAQDNSLLIRPNPDTTAVEFTGADGGEMVSQRNSTYTQPIKGLIIPKSTTYWALVSKLGEFFRINHNYSVIYKKKDGKMFKQQGAWISSGLQITPRPYEEYSEWSVELTIGHPQWTEYVEDAQGEEIYANSVELPLISANQGGEVWDAVGGEWDAVGEVWEVGSGGLQTITVSSTGTIYPVWIVAGPCVDPVLQNNTTDSICTYTGSIPAGASLVVDFSEGTAKIGNTIVTRFMNGIVTMVDGQNVMGFSKASGDTESSTLAWNNVIN